MTATASTSVLRYPTVVDRTYKRYVLPSSEDVCYLRHPSGVVVVTLSAKKAASLPEGVTVTGVNWNTSQKKKGVDRSKMKVVGKSKKGALQLQPETRLCILEFSDGSELTIRAGIKGLLLEVNARLEKNPDLVRTARENQGYICLLMPPPGTDRRHRPKEFNEDTQLL
uniref:Protein Abitram n=1 Tax=Steinernema glaseri TaxID=37863 RepID=A0A1I7Z5X0_9BILA